MSDKERMENTKDRVTGKVREGAGKLTGDKKEETKGKAQNMTGKVKDKLKDVKDSAEGAIEELKDKMHNDDK
jgi:uncharacterized protein YjbJ (UPF0337 family)